MKAIQFEKTGGPEVLELKDIELAPPRRGQVRLRHSAIGVNFIDTYQRSGLYPVALPSGLGLEAAGTVEALGEAVTTFKIGDRAGYCGGPLGAYAEANNVAADRLVKLPSTISDEVAAAGMLKGMTVQYLLKRTYRVQHGQTILFHSAAGGVGLIAGQWAKHLGATVIGTVGSDDKIELARSHGYDHVLNLRKDNWVNRVREIAASGVPVVYDFSGQRYLERFARLLGDPWHDGELRQLVRRGAGFRARHLKRQRIALSDASHACALHRHAKAIAGHRR